MSILKKLKISLIAGLFLLLITGQEAYADQLSDRAIEPSYAEIDGEIDILCQQEEEVSIEDILPEYEKVTGDRQQDGEREGRLGFSYDATTASLKSGNYEKYIDRMELPDYCESFYEALIESTDNDGNEDYLIEDKYQTDTSFVASDKRLYKGKYMYAIAELDKSEYNSDSIKKLYGASSISTNALMTVYAFREDYPQVFFINKNLSMGYLAYAVTKGSDKSYYCLFYFSLSSLRLPYMDGKQKIQVSENLIKEQLAKDEEAIETICSQAENYDANGDGVKGSSCDRVCYFNKWLTQNNGYNTLVAADSSADSNSTGKYMAWQCVSALMGNSGEDGPVCEGYSRALKCLCDHEGIGCVLVRSASHMWNYVCIGSSWYGVDSTWNDPAAGDVKKSGYETERYLLVGADTVISGSKFINSHKVKNLGYSKAGCIELNNGPELSLEAYEREKDADAAEIVSVSADVTELYYGYEKGAAIDVVVTGTDGCASLQWYSCKDAGEEEIEGANGKAMPTGLLSGVYFCRAQLGDKYKDSERVTVKPREISVSARNMEIYYGEDIPEAEFFLVSGELCEGDELSCLGISVNIALSDNGISVNALEIKPGSYEIRVTAMPDEDRYTVSCSSGQLLVKEYAGTLIRLPEEEIIYTGKAQKIEPAVIYNGEIVPRNYYSIKYKNNKKACPADTADGTLAKVPQLTIKYNGKFTKLHGKTASEVKSFYIERRSIEEGSITLNTIKPLKAGKCLKAVKKVELNINGKNVKLKYNRDYSMVYINKETGVEYTIKDKGIPAGRYRVRLTGIGNFCGSLETELILPVM